ncbi:MAG: hypothetical protein ATN35_12735 [Epulopiscium sp. Nele67-Bin004]|nr:MAG: hypothetical protein ATN35_12735 [Epulopiscium sp. Nele67-Bin004]
MILTSRKLSIVLKTEGDKTKTLSINNADPNCDEATAVAAAKAILATDIFYEGDEAVAVEEAYFTDTYEVDVVNPLSTMGATLDKL